MRFAFQKSKLAIANSRRIMPLAALALFTTAACGAPSPGTTLSELYDGISSPFASGLASPEAAGLAVSIELDTEFGGDSDYDTFELELGESSASIKANTRSAAIYAADALAAALADARSSNGAQPPGVIRERAALKVRALHIQMRRMTLPRLRTLIDKARHARMNTLLLYVADDVEFEAAGIVPLKNAMSKKDFMAGVAYARASGMRVIPHLPLLTKQHRFFKQDAPELMYNNATYDPRNPETMRRVYAHLEEIIELIQPDAIHIGHDEVEGSFPRRAFWKRNDKQKEKWLREGEQMLPPELFLEHVKDLHAFLAERSVQTWIWGDMLLTREEFPDLAKRKRLDGGEYAKLRSQLPQDIVICDWHYKYEGEKFATAQAFADLGYQVLGATRENPKNIAAFSRYMAGMGEGGAGMIATLWSLVNQGGPDLVDDVIARSGREFWSPGTAPK